MPSIHVRDMYKVKHPEEFAEKFPQPKKPELDSGVSPSERVRLEKPIVERPRSEEVPEPEEGLLTEEGEALEEAEVKASKKKKK